MGVIDYASLGRHIREAREKAGFSQTELALKAGLSVVHMSHIETGSTKLSLEALVQIANAIPVSTDPLLVDSLADHMEVTNNAFTELVRDCSRAEITALYKILQETKTAIRSGVDERLREMNSL